MFQRRRTSALVTVVLLGVGCKGPDVGKEQKPFEMLVSLSELPRGMSESETLAAVQRAAQVWAAPCSSLRIGVQSTGAFGRLGRDKLRTLSFRRSWWCPDGKEGQKPCYPEDALAMTSTYSNYPPLDDGAPESDIEINAVVSKWSILGNSDSNSLVRVLAHEIGHTLGFVHPCNDGSEVHGSAPSCSSLAAAERNQVMFPAPPDPARKATEPVPQLSRGEMAELCRRFPVQR